MTYNQLFSEIKQKRTFLCVGLDTDINKIPQHLRGNDFSLFEFNRQIVDATAKYCVAYKPNLAFYEAYGEGGMQQLQMTVDYIKTNYPSQFVIADAKRGDIGNTSQMYAQAFFEAMNVDAVTLSPYMGEDTAKPFFTFAGKWAVLLALTSNPSAADFQLLKTDDGKFVYEKVLERSKEWGSAENTMYVVGATKAEMLAGIRKIVPNHFLLIPGVGAQGGSLSEVAKYGMNAACGLLVNSSRAIIYAGNDENFAAVAAQKAQAMQEQMNELLNKANI